MQEAGPTFARCGSLCSHINVTPACCVGRDVPEIISIAFDFDKAAIVACCTICSELYAFGLYSGIRFVLMFLDLLTHPPPAGQPVLERPPADEEPWRSVGRPLPQPRSDAEQRAFLTRLGAVWTSPGVKEVFESLSAHEEEELLLAIGFHLIVRAQVGIAAHAAATQTHVPIRTHRSPPATEMINYGGGDAFEGHALCTGNAEGAQPLKIHVAATHAGDAARVESELSRATCFAGAACILVTRLLPGATGEFRVWMSEPDSSSCKVRMPFTPVVAASATLLVAAKKFSLRVAGQTVNQKLGGHRVVLAAGEIPVLLGDNLAAAAALARDVGRRMVFGLGDDASNFLFKWAELFCPLTPLVCLLGIGIEYQAVASHSRRPLTYFPRPPPTVRDGEGPGGGWRGVYAPETPREPAGRGPCPSPLSPATGCAPFTAHPNLIHLWHAQAVRLVDGEPVVSQQRPKPSHDSREADQRAGGLLSQAHRELVPELYPVMGHGADAAGMTLKMRSDSVDFFERYNPTLWKAVQSYGPSTTPCAKAGNLFGALRVMEDGEAAVDVTEMRLGLREVPQFVDLALGDPRAPPVQRCEMVRREGALFHLGDARVGQYVYEYGRCFQRGAPCEASYADINHEWSVCSAAGLVVGVTLGCDSLLEGCPTAADHLELVRSLADNCAQMSSLPNSRNMAFALRRFNAQSGKSVIRCLPRWIVPRLVPEEGQCPRKADTGQLAALALPAAAAQALLGPVESAAPAGSLKRPRASYAVTSYLGLAAAVSGASVPASLPLARRASARTGAEASVPALSLHRVLLRASTAPLSMGARTEECAGGDDSLAEAIRVRAAALATTAPATATPATAARARASEAPLAEAALATEAIRVRAAGPTAAPTVARAGRVPVGRLQNRPELKQHFHRVHASDGPDLDAAPAPAAALLPVPSAAVPPGPVILIEAAPSAPAARHAGNAVCPAGHGPTGSEGRGIATSAGSKRRREGGVIELVDGYAPSVEDEQAGDDDDLVVDAAPAADPLRAALDHALARTQSRRVMARPSWGGAAVTEGGLHIAVLN